MHARTTLYTLGLALVCASGCSLGEVGAGDDSTTGDDGDLPSSALCESTLTMSGSLTPPGAPPDAALGCVPQGTWAVQVTVDLGTCDDAPMADTYTYTVTGEGRDQIVDYTGSASEELALGIHAGGNGECEGSFEHIWPGEAGSGEFHVALLKPYFEPGTLTIVGEGTYQLWSSHP